VSKKKIRDKDGFRFEADELPSQPPKKPSARKERAKQKRFHDWENQNARVVRDWNQILD
jgi:hypothetical protein